MNPAEHESCQKWIPLKVNLAENESLLIRIPQDLNPVKSECRPIRIPSKPNPARFESCQIWIQPERISLLDRRIEAHHNQTRSHIKCDSVKSVCTQKGKNWLPLYTISTGYTLWLNLIFVVRKNWLVNHYYLILTLKLKQKKCIFEKISLLPKCTRNMYFATVC